METGRRHDSRCTRIASEGGKSADPGAQKSGTGADGSSSSSGGGMEQGGSSRRNSKTYAVDEAFFSDDNSAALGGTSCLVHGYVAAGVALAMTVPFLPFMPWWTNSPTNPYTNMTHSQERFYKEWGRVSEDCVGVVVVETRPIDATLWAPYAASTSQDEIYIAVYLLSALLLALFLRSFSTRRGRRQQPQRRPRSGSLGCGRRGSAFKRTTRQLQWPRRAKE